ncbi:hypothetical protein RJ639_020517 [Escallonia herrerae]|uniref:HAT C-terminal dimerisation domain-containing protein n=1 Tax=Escallonia herrerae TaxID=1293975 RepID=A0AA88V2B5_9ASTE|nr:hypothetical protein RJ639_020517 [Escallonia herrerae]
MCSKITRSEKEALVQEEVAANLLFGGNSKAHKLPAEVFFLNLKPLPIVQQWKLWRDMYGGGAPELHCLALKVLSQSVNSSSAERCWSTYSYIHNVKRNRPGVAKAKKLVFVHYNGRLLTRFWEDYESKYKNWDANPEIMNIEQSGPSLEAIEAYENDDDVDEGNDDDIATTNPMTPSRSSTLSSTAVTPTSTTSTPHSSTPPAQNQEAETQVVSGIKYYLKNSAATPTDAHKIFEAVVVVKPWLHSKQLLHFLPSPATK